MFMEDLEGGDVKAYESVGCDLFGGSAFLERRIGGSGGGVFRDDLVYG